MFLCRYERVVTNGAVDIVECMEACRSQSALKHREATIKRFSKEYTQAEGRCLLTYVNLVRMHLNWSTKSQFF